MKRWHKAKVVLACLAAVSACGGTADPGASTTSSSAAPVASTTTTATDPSTAPPSTTNATPPSTAEPTETEVIEILATEGWEPRALVANEPFKWRAHQITEIVDTNPPDEAGAEARAIETEQIGHVEGGEEYREYALTLDVATYRAQERVIIDHTMWGRIGVSEGGVFYSAQDEPDEQQINDIRYLAALGLLNYGQTLYVASPELQLERLSRDTIGDHPATHYQAVIMGEDEESLVEAELDFWVAAGPRIVRLTYVAREVDKHRTGPVIEGTVTRTTEFELYDVGVRVDPVVAPGSGAAEIDRELVVLADLGQLINLLGLPETFTATDALDDTRSLCDFMGTNPAPLSEAIFDEMDRLQAARAQSLDLDALDADAYDLVLFTGTDEICPDLPDPDAVPTTTGVYESKIAHVEILWADAASGTGYEELPNEHVSAEELLQIAGEACGVLESDGVIEGFFLQLIVGLAELQIGETDPIVKVVETVLLSVATEVECPQHRVGIRQFFDQNGE